MSVPLQYATRCARCKGFMAPGTTVDFHKDGNNYSHWHAEGFADDGITPMDGCELAAAQAKVTKLRPRFEIRCCSDPGCYAGVPGWAFRAGDARAAGRLCHICGKPWLAEELAVAA